MFLEFIRCVSHRDCDLDDVVAQKALHSFPQQSTGLVGVHQRTGPVFLGPEVALSNRIPGLHPERTFKLSVKRTWHLRDDKKE